MGDDKPRHGLTINLRIELGFPDKSSHLKCEEPPELISAPPRRVVKSQKAEALLPAFDIGRKVGGKIRLQRHRRAVVLCVVDVADFDGSLPRAALQAWFPTLGLILYRSLTLTLILPVRGCGSPALHSCSHLGQNACGAVRKHSDAPLSVTPCSLRPRPCTFPEVSPAQAA